MEAQVGAGGGDEGRMRGWSRRRVATEPSNGELRRRVAEEPGDGGHEGGLTTAAIDGQSVATKVAKEAVATEGRNEAWRRRVAW